MSNSPDGGNPGDGGAQRRPGNAVDRRTFLSTSALLGLGFAAGCSGLGRDGAGMLPAPSMLQAVPDGNTRALQIFNSSGIARDLGAWLESHGLRQESGRAALFDVPAVSELPPGLTADDRPSLVAESAYRTFQNDAYARSRLTTDQLAAHCAAGNAATAAEVARVIHRGGGKIKNGCSCSSSSCDNGCCSCNNGDQLAIRHDGAFQVAAVPYGDPGVNYSGPVRQYLRGNIGVQANGEAVGILETVSNDAGMSVQEYAILLLDRQTRQVSVYRFGPQELAAVGPDGVADRLFGPA